MALSQIGSSVYADDKLIKKPVPVQVKPKDSHISLDQLRTEAGASVMIMMTNEGVLTLTGHIESLTELNLLKTKARNVKGVVKIISLVDTD